MINQEQIVFKEGKMDLKKIFGAFGALVLLLATLSSVFAAVPYVETVEDFQSDIEDLAAEYGQLKADFEEAKADFNKKGDTNELKKTLGFLESLYTSIENLENQINTVGGNQSHNVYAAMPGLLAQTAELQENVQDLINEGESLIGVVHNTAPVLANPGNKEVEEGKLLEFTLSAVDAEGDVLGYSAENLPAGAVFDGAAKKFSWTPAVGQAGVYTVTFKATDGKETTLETITITVKATATGNAPPADSGTGSTPAQTTETDEEKYDALKDKLEDYEDDFDDLKEDWKKANTDKKKKNVEDDLDDLDEDLKDLKKEASSLKSEVTDDNVKDDLDDLKDDISKLREDISNLINGVEEDTSSKNIDEETVKETKKTTYTATEEEEPEVVFNQLPASIVPSIALEPVEPKNDMTMIYVLGGVAAAIVLLILVFIIVALVR